MCHRVHLVAVRHHEIVTVVLTDLGFGALSNIHPADGAGEPVKGNCWCSTKLWSQDPGEKPETTQTPCWPIKSRNASEREKEWK